MNTKELFTLSFNAIWGNKMRSFLTTLGITIGVFAIIVLVSIGSGLQAYISSQISSLGPNIMDVIPGNNLMSAFGPGTQNKFTIPLAQRLSDRLAPIAQVAPLAEVLTNVKYKNVVDKNVYAIGSTYNFPKAVVYGKTIMGRWFSQGQEQSGSKVAVIGYTVYTKFFSNKNPIGEKIFVGNEKYTVVGVAEKNGASLGVDHDNVVYIPIEAVHSQFGVDRLMEIVVNTNSETNVPIVKKQINAILSKDLNPDEYSIQTGDSLSKTLSNITGMLSLALGGIAAISLLVGGIGVANIMLVSVTERTKEIGLRKALGAKRNDILSQFLLEAVMLSMTGGIIGILLGMIASIIIAMILVSSVTFWSVALAFCFSVAVGIIFGMAPAIRASKLSPIDALRYE